MSADRKKSALPLFFAAAAFVWLLLLYREALHGLFAAWQTEEYGHAPFIVVIALFWVLLLLQQRRPPFTGSIVGAVLLLAALAVNQFGALIANNWSSQISLVAGVAALGLAFCGRRALRTVAAAIVFLFFAVPLPATLTPALTAQLQLLSSDLGVALIQLIGLPVFQEGNVIDLGGYKLQVAEACSGLRYLFPLMSLGYLAAFCFFESAWKRWTLFLLTIPIAVGLNVVRIVLVSVTVDAWGIAMAQGLLHAFEGWAIFLGCIACLVAAERILARIGPRESAPFFEIFSFSWHKPLWEGAWIVPARAVCAVFLVLVLSTAAQYFTASLPAEKILQRQSFIDFPMHIGPWTGKPGALSASDLGSLKLTDYLLADYSDGTTYPVNFYIAYYASQKQDSPIHSPRICIPGAGWTIVSIAPVTLTLATEPARTLIVNKAIIQRDTVRDLVFYWFQESGTDEASSYTAKLLMVRNALRLSRTDGSLIRFTTPIADGQDEQQAEKKLTRFISAAFPLLPAYLPGP